MPRRQKSPAAGSPLERIRELAALLDEYGLSAISMSWGDVRVRLERSPAPVPVAAPVPAVRPAPLVPPAALTEVSGAAAPTQVTIEAPMVGTFYRAASPGAEPFIREGDTIKEGQVLCIIEAMKLMNEIEAKTAGRVAKILVENGVAVEFGQPLFLVEPLR